MLQQSEDMKYYLFFDQATQEVILFNLQNKSHLPKRNYHFKYQRTLEISKSEMLSPDNKFRFKEGKRNLLSFIWNFVSVYVSDEGSVEMCFTSQPEINDQNIFAQDSQIPVGDLHISIFDWSGQVQDIKRSLQIPEFQFLKFQELLYNKI